MGAIGLAGAKLAQHSAWAWAWAGACEHSSWVGSRRAGASKAHAKLKFTSSLLPRAMSKQGGKLCTQVALWPLCSAGGTCL